MQKEVKKNYEDSRSEKLIRLFNLAINMTTKPYTFKMIQDEYCTTSKKTTYRVIANLKSIFGAALKERGCGLAEKTWRIGALSPLAKMISFSTQQIGLIEKYKKSLVNSKLSTDAIDAILNKMICLNADKRHLTDADIEYLTETEDYVRRPLPHHKVNTEITDVIQNAIDMCHIMECTYKNDADDTIRNIQPYAIVHGTNSLLIAKQRNQEGELIFKSFRIDKLKYVKDLRVEFEKDENFSLKEYMKDCFGVYHGDKPMNVELKFSKNVADEVKQYQFHSSQKFSENSDGSVNVSMYVGGKYELCWHLFTWGQNVQIISPKELIDTYEELLKNALGTIKK